jgi:hypothetical protein
LSRRGTLKQSILDFISRASEGNFDALALDVARYQRDTLPAYGALVAGCGDPLEHWKNAPLVPTEIFREIDLSPANNTPQATFLTSGTTGIARRGMRRVPDLDLYHAGCRDPFIASVLNNDATPKPWVSLIPSMHALPDSSLSHMIQILGDELASSLVFGATSNGLDVPTTVAALEACTKKNEPYVLLTTSFALMMLLDATSDLPKAPKGSRMMLTGGFKGRTRRVNEGDLLGMIQTRLGFEPANIVGEYGMTELSSQAYGKPFQSPPWLRMRVVDPTHLQDVAAGQQGLVAFFDLLNLDNVSAILTSDLGVLDAHGGLTLLGRAPGSRTRGCSLQAEEWGAM